HAHAVEYGIRCVKMDPVIVLTTHPGCKYRQDRARYRGLRERAERRPRATTQCHDYRSSRRHCRARGAAPFAGVDNIPPFVTALGLMSYGVDFTDVFRQAASVRGSRVKNDPGLSGMQFLREASTPAARVEVFTQPRPFSDMGASGKGPILRHLPDPRYYFNVHTRSCAA